ncbi:MAG: DUF3455 domain-containing protein [Pseudonocardia sp.]|nr:DUF3455 domain-containing protein [Pseudonocardia sp.]
MKRRLLASLAATAAVATSLLISSAGPAAAADSAAAPEVSTANAQSARVSPNKDLPANIQVTDTGVKIVATLRGVGKQIYDCDGAKYVFREPAAGLFTLRGIPAGIHGKGPFWTNFDGSRVEGKDAIQANPTPPGFTPNDVPWLKLTAVNPPQGTGGVFTNVKFIQRIDTKGGQPPASCTGGAALAVNYTANYVFWA